MITHTGSHKIIARMTDVEWTTGRTSIIELWYIASNKMENLALLRRHLVVGVFGLIDLIRLIGYYLEEIKKT